MAKILDSIKQNIISDYQSGVSSEQLAAKFNLTKQAIRRIVKLAGVSNKSGGQCSYDVNYAISLWNDQLTLEQIANIIGVSKTSIYHQLNKHNIDTSKKRIDSNKVIDLVLQQLTDQQIADQLNCSVNYISKIRLSVGFHKKRYLKITNTIETITDFLNNNKYCSFQQFRQIFNQCDYSTLVKHFDNARPGIRENCHRDNLISLDDNQVIDIIEQLHKGKSKQSIIAEYPITQYRLNQIIDQFVPNYTRINYTIPDSIYQKLNDKQWCEQAYQDSYNEDNQIVGYKGIALNHFNALVTADTVAAYFAKHNIKKKDIFDRYPVLRDKQWLQQQYEQKSYQQIADQLGVSHPTVRKALIECGIEIAIDVGVSKLEQRLVNAIQQFYTGPIITNDRTLIKPQEIDIVFPELNIGIEVCGLYWHSERFKGNNYHVDKLNKCHEIGIRLITIFEDELMFEFDKVISKLKSIVQLNTNKVFARKCKIVQLSNAQAEQFFNNYHIQNYVPGSVRIGLMFNDTLVAAMSFKQYSNDVYELSRYATSDNVVGGFSKLLSYFKRNHQFNQIFTYADLRWSSRTNNVYVKNNFIELHVTKPAYFYCDNITKRRIHRMHFQKKLLKQKFENYDDSLSERENANRNNYFAIYDCGNVKYVINQ